MEDQAAVAGMYSDGKKKISVLYSLNAANDNLF